MPMAICAARSASGFLQHVHFEPDVRPALRGGGVPGENVAAQQPELDSGELPSMVLRHAGLDPRAYRCQPLRRREPHLLRRLGADSSTTAHKLIAARSELLPQALDTLLIGVSDFFREGAAFERLADIAAARIQAGREYRIASLGCSDGRELYSLMMLLAERDRLEPCRCWGVDCRPTALETARRAVYDEAAVEKAPPHLRARYFVHGRGTARVVGALRRKATWLCRDVLQPLDLPPLDLILWRNVSIYLQPPAAAQVWAQLARQLRPAGLVLVGKAERPPGSLSFRRLAPCISEAPDEGGCNA